MALDLSGLQTEGRNPRSTDIDKVTTLELCQIINSEDATVAAAVRECLPRLADAIDTLAARVNAEGRVIYVGAGTSGRLGVLDASELPPTFRANPGQFIALIAGGDVALRHAQEGAEDDEDAAVADLVTLKLNGERDCLIGIAASGRTPYVLACLEYAHSLGCFTVGVACAYPSKMSCSAFVDNMISVVTGPEVITGSTRLKAGTATKLVLNMLSTGTMIKIGKTFGNIMIDVKATNEKLRQRSRNIIRMSCGTKCERTDAGLDELLLACYGSVKLAVASLILDVGIDEARGRLADAGGVLTEVLDGHHALGEAARNHVNGVSDQEYLLCVDGGGSKCAAIIGDREGGLWRAEGGPCNAVSVGIDNVVSTIRETVEGAIQGCPALKGKQIHGVEFKKIWIGLAGYDRPSISQPLNSLLAKLFNRKVGEELRMSTDIEMVVLPAMRRSSFDTAIAVISGTGSIAMKFSLKGGELIRTGRSGGWGPLLGDQGSGFDIGRAALQHCLEEQDRIRNDVDMSSKGPTSHSRLCQEVLDHFGVSNGTEQDPDLLSAIISPTEPNADTRTSIASVARLVLQLGENDPTSAAIIEAAAARLARLILSLNMTRAECSSALLVATGGVMQSSVFKERFQAALSHAEDGRARHSLFGSVTWVVDPGRAALEYLLTEP
jgi:N-acetylmuramic acid 6-phosphate etherase